MDHWPWRQGQPLGSRQVTRGSCLNEDDTQTNDGKYHHWAGDQWWLVQCRWFTNWGWKHTYNYFALLCVLIYEKRSVFLPSYLKTVCPKWWKRSKYVGVQGQSIVSISRSGMKVCVVSLEDIGMAFFFYLSVCQTVCQIDILLGRCIKCDNDNGITEIILWAFQDTPLTFHCTRLRWCNCWKT